MLLNPLLLNTSEDELHGDLDLAALATLRIDFSEIGQIVYSGSRPIPERMIR